MTDDGLWMTVTEVAAAKGVSKQAVSKRAARLAQLGLITIRAGKAGSRLINLAEFDHAVGETTDAVRALNGASGGATGTDPVLAREQARRAAYDADLKKLDLDERLGKLVPVEDVENAMVRCGEVIVRAVERLNLRSEEMAAAVAKDGAQGARALLKQLARELRTAIAQTLTLAAQEGEPEAP